MKPNAYDFMIEDWKKAFAMVADIQLQLNKLAEFMVAITPRIVQEETDQISAILSGVASHFRIPLAIIINKQTKEEPFVTARMVAMYYLRLRTNFSSAYIGRIFDTEAHHRVNYAVRIIKERREVDKAFNTSLVRLDAHLDAVLNQGPALHHNLT